MMSRLILVLIMVFCASCGEYVPEVRTIVKVGNSCTEESKSDRASFILQCIQNANPKSDEEPEGWIKICQKMAEDTLCEARRVELEQTKLCGYCSWTTANATLLPRNPQ